MTNSRGSTLLSWGIPILVLSLIVGCGAGISYYADQRDRKTAAAWGVKEEKIGNIVRIFKTEKLDYRCPNSYTVWSQAPNSTEVEEKRIISHCNTEVKRLVDVPIGQKSWIFVRYKTNSYLKTEEATLIEFHLNSVEVVQGAGWEYRTMVGKQHVTVSGKTSVAK